MASNEFNPNGLAAAAEWRAQFDGVLPREPASAPDLDAMFAGLQLELQAERGPRAWLRSRPTALRVSAGLACIALVAGAFAIGWPRPDRGVYPAERQALSVIVLGGLISLELLLALRPLQRPPLPTWVAPLALASAIAGLLGLCALPAAHTAHPTSLQAPGIAALFSRALPCLAIGLAIAAASYVLLRALDRGGAWHALLAAACSGLLANLALQLHCPVTDPRHMLVAHASVALLLLAVIALRRARGRPAL